jgi:hypothetical protein
MKGFEVVEERALDKKNIDTANSQDSSNVNSVFLKKVFGGLMYLRW